MAVNRLYVSTVQKKSNKTHPSIIKSASHFGGGGVGAEVHKYIAFLVRKISIACLLFSFSLSFSFSKKKCYIYIYILYISLIN